ncbi:MAG: Ribose-phosphate pyrophosphokinase [Fimbriimonadales bacterium]|nr:MAG: ribose-phosphate pyrophosphokinase [Armatimonadota bacterium]MBV6502121.1 Ribose-phosphate pyrophosphokinase [Fimbriimonadales bacterium]MCE7898956.1 ribose-phosphate pyrophosphokinase [Armatimonadetes bacterium ATM1]MDL1927410.1 ribose-phosphate pyrophosphokinase [Fimbriimonadia bacterium ATM]MBC6969687.1 ribose-phosphate pyrophosphokinase [Armatimonadota bacterium]
MAKAEAAETRVESEVRNGTENGDLSQLKLFTGNAHPELAHDIADYLDVEMGRMTCTRFSDGETQVQVNESARGCDVFLIQPTCAPTNDNIMELLIMLDAFRRASAKRVTVVMPYYGYARQDKKIKPREPVTARLIADLITMAGANRVLTCDLHAEQIQGFFDIPVDHLYLGPTIGRFLIQEGYADQDVVVVSPDVGGVGRARALAEMLRKPIAIIAKRRPEPGKVEVMEIIGDVEGKQCVIIDDMIDTGNSVMQGVEALLKRGATDVVLTCTHAVFSANAPQRMSEGPVSRVICTDTIPIDNRKRFPKLTVLPAAPLMAEAIRRIHLDLSVSSLFNS